MPGPDYNNVRATNQTRFANLHDSTQAFVPNDEYLMVSARVYVNLSNCDQNLLLAYWWTVLLQFCHDRQWRCQFGLVQSCATSDRLCEPRCSTTIYEIPFSSSDEHSQHYELYGNVDIPQLRIRGIRPWLYQSQDRFHHTDFVLKNVSLRCECRIE